MPSATASLLKLFLPDFKLENFEFKGVIEDSETFHIELQRLFSTDCDSGFSYPWAQGVLVKSIR